MSVSDIKMEVDEEQEQQKVIFSYDLLFENFQDTKKELTDAEDTIRRLTGREPDEFNSAGNIKWRSIPPPGPPKVIPSRKRSLFSSRKHEDDSTSSSEDESSDEDVNPSKKPTLQSTVVAAKKREAKTRKETIQEQNMDSKVTERNRRMFGMIMGTLQRFQREEKKRIPQVMKRAEIEQKVEAAAEEEKERIKREKKNLFLIRREKQTQLRCLEKKLEIAECHQIWENNYKNMQKFIKTKTSPPIFFAPAKHSEATKKRLEETKSKLQEKMQEHRSILEKEILEIEEWYKKDTFPTNKENIKPDKESEKQDAPTDNKESTNAEGNQAPATSEVDDKMDLDSPQLSEEPEHIKLHDDDDEEDDDKQDESSDEESNEAEASTQSVVQSSSDKMYHFSGDQEFEPIYDE